MEFFKFITSNRIINIGVVAILVAHTLKLMVDTALNRKITWSRFIGAGGMPSSHSALVASVTVGTFRIYGFTSPVFALSCVLSLIVMYDAFGVRRAAGKQAKIINLIIEQFNITDPKIREEKLKEILGHTPLEVMAGAVLGLIIGFLLPIF